MLFFLVANKCFLVVNVGLVVIRFGRYRNDAVKILNN